jgi:hypothetical protein
MQLGLDIHGVIDKDPEFFAKLTKDLRLDGHEVHIITGVEHGSRLNKELIHFGVQFDALFSITSHHKELGTQILRYDNDDESRPIFNDEMWDITKAHYCCQHKLDIHIDDSSVYGKYFHAIDTQYILYNEAMQEFLTFLTTGVL